MSNFKAKMHQIRFPLEELTALPQTSTVLRGLLLRGGRSKGERGGKGKVKGRAGGRDLVHPKILV